MALTLNGTAGSIGGLVAGGLPDNSITTSEIAASNVTPAKLSQPLTQATSQASTSGTAINFTNIPSWAKRITVMFDNVSTNGSSLVMIQLGSGSYTTTGYNGNSSAYTNAATPTTSVNTVGFMSSSGGSAGDLRNGAFTLTNLSGNTWICTGQFSVATYVTTGTGQITLSGTLDRLRVTTFNGTDVFDNGNINIMYEG